MYSKQTTLKSLGRTGQGNRQKTKTHIGGSTKTSKSGGGGGGGKLSSLDEASTERKDSIINEAVDCVFNQIPEIIFELDEFLKDLIKYSKENYEQETMLSKDYFGQMLEQWRVAANKTRPFVADNQELPVANMDQTDVSTLLSHCWKHLLPDRTGGQQQRHFCFNRYSLLESLNIYSGFDHDQDGLIPSFNQQFDGFCRRLRSTIIKLSDQLMKINVGFSLLYPKCEDNEDANIDLDVLNKIMELTSVETIDTSDLVSDRSDLIRVIKRHPHSEETCFMLAQFDHQSCSRIKFEVQKLITHCCRLYDILYKNLDRVIQSRKKCEKNERKSSEDNISSVYS